MQKLNMVDADTLLYQPLDKPRFVVDGLIPTGLILFCGSQKIGKSWLMLKLCLCVSAGLPFWEMETRAGDVLYLCLEDTFFRIQDRLFRLTDEADSRLHFAVASCKLTDGLIVQLEDYLKEYPDSRLIVIDTLQKVRTASKDNAYASDYGDISQIKEFADRHSLAVIVVHHIRKQNDSDVFNKVSGTTGLTGSADATFVLEKETRASDTARLYCVGRDIKGNPCVRYRKALLCRQGYRVSGVCPAFQGVQLGDGGAQGAGAACEGKHTACPFSVDGVHAG